MSSLRNSTSSKIGLRINPPSPPADLYDGWPQRLLHIPTRKSLKREGNQYGGHHAPEYSALSYTWGRFKLGDDENPDVKAIEIGVDWAIPRIRPDHFTVDNFQQVIGSIEARGTEFLWLDIACVDQSEDSPDGELEVGRQAAIFQRAKETYIWLTTVAIGDWEVLLESKFGSEIYVDHMNIIERVLDDPWFTSLWTLQEAYLCGGKSHMLGGVGAEMLRISLFEISFDVISRVCLWLIGILGGPANVVGIEDKAKAWIQVLNRSGVIAIASRNPLQLYAAAAYRVATKPPDYIYGFQQVFGLQLGKTMPGTPKGKFYTLPELEDQFGAFLLENYPAESQMHVFSSAQDGKGWHMNRFSRISGLFTFPPSWFDTIFSMQIPQEPLCELESRLTESQVMGHFSGHLCFADDFLKAIDKDDTVELFAALDWQKPSDNIGSDLCQLLKLVTSAHPSRVDIRTYGLAPYIGHRSDLSQLERELEKIRKLDTRVLKLGKLKLGDSTSTLRTRLNRDRHEYETVISGLILEKEKPGHWRRLGICLWKLGGSIEDMEDFGEIKWTAEEGYFG